MKKVTVCIFAILVFFQGLTVLAAGDNVNETIGSVIGLEDDRISIIGEAITDGGLPELVIQVNDAPIFDLLTGLPIKIDDIAPGMGIRVAYRPSMDGRPAPAVAVWMNWDFEEAAVFTVLVSENIQYGTDSVIFLSADGKYRVAFTRETQILDYNHNPLNPGDIAPGMEFFVWVDMITASCPALVYPDKVVQIY
ncbi:MAG: hypothetical protein FWB91_12950 [Defluviitaleaceae bacterium]|nr:hypothetical protein [Defluviitaleaceae bacterium]